MPKKKVVKKIIPKRQVETANQFCKKKNCCFKGRLGPDTCCDYILHMGTARPHRISECPGYRKVIIQTDMKTEKRKIHKNEQAAAKALNMSKGKVMQAIKDNRTINGFSLKKAIIPLDQLL